MSKITEALERAVAELAGVCAYIRADPQDFPTAFPRVAELEADAAQLRQLAKDWADIDAALQAFAVGRRSFSWWQFHGGSPVRWEVAAEYGDHGDMLQDGGPGEATPTAALLAWYRQRNPDG